MKTELNDSLRTRFFVQYLSTCDCGEHGEDFRIEWNRNTLHDFLEAEQEDAFLFLRPIPSITDEEAIGVAKIMKVEQSDFWTDQFKAYRVYEGDPKDKELDYDASFAKAGRQYVAHFFRTTKWSNNNISYFEEGGIVHVSDYLRSIGIALPFMGYSVEELVKAGWVKLTT